MHDAVGRAGGAWAAEQRAVLSARPSGPAPGLGDAGRRLRGAKSPKTRFLSAGRVVQLVNLIVDSLTYSVTAALLDTTGASLTY